MECSGKKVLMVKVGQKGPQDKGLVKLNFSFMFLVSSVMTTILTGTLLKMCGTPLWPALFSTLFLPDLNLFTGSGGL